MTIDEVIQQLEAELLTLETELFTLENERSTLGDLRYMALVHQQIVNLKAIR